VQQCHSAHVSYRKAISDAIKGFDFSYFTPISFQMKLSLHPIDCIRIKVMSLSHKSVTLKEGLLKCNCMPCQLAIHVTCVATLGICFFFFFFFEKKKNVIMVISNYLTFFTMIVTYSFDGGFLLFFFFFHFHTSFLGLLVTKVEYILSWEPSPVASFILLCCVW
jgi:hypothetical protein